MRFRILGPLEVWSGQDWSGIGAAKWRALLAALLLCPGEVVSTDRLIDEIWGNTPPARAANAVAVYVLRLRRLIGDDEGHVLVTRQPGYQLLLGPDDLDAARFETLVGEGRSALAAGAPEQASSLLTEALALWRGHVLADVAQSDLVEAEANRLEERRVTAATLRLEAEIACGRAAGAIADLQRLAADHPLHEEVWALLMRALHAVGRQAEALETYERVRSLIADQLGVDPGAELQRVHQQILEADARIADQRTATPEAVAHMQPPQAPAAPAAPDAPAGPPDREATVRPVASQLPADIPDFTGRGELVKYLRGLLSDTSGGEEGACAVAVALVVGAGGLGKTTLAIHAAHRLRPRFPDGQLYITLRGASEHPAHPADVIARFLRDLGVDGSMIPVAQDDRAALYRSMLAGRQMLIVLDDARDEAQVRPLLPGTASCGVIVTSRSHMPGLSGARLIDLDVLDEDEARVLLTRIVGAERLEAEPGATARVLAACAGLPLAIRIAGARLATRARWTIETLARRLADERRSIDEFTAGDLAVRACFQVSFSSLPKGRDQDVDPARAFRLLGLWHGPSLSLQAAAAMLGEPEDRVADALEVLVDAHLLQSPASDRYRLHDLLRVYAAERAEAEEPQGDRDAAILRVLAWYLHTTAAADRVVSPHRDRVPLDPPPPGCAALTFSTVDTAVDWWEAEHANLVAATQQAEACRRYDIGWKLPVAAMVCFDHRGYRDEWISTHRIALASARALADRRGEAWVLNNLGMALGRQRDDTAIACLQQALAIRRELGDQRGEAQAANNLVDVYMWLGRFTDALEPSRQALAIQREAGHRHGEGIALNNLGEVYEAVGRLEEAIDCLHQARRIFEEIHDARGEGYVLHNIGRAYLSLGRDDDALGCLERALLTRRATGDRVWEAMTLKDLGRVQHRLRRPEEARASWERALAIFRAFGDEQEANEILSELHGLSLIGERS